MCRTTKVEATEDEIRQTLWRCAVTRGSHLSPQAREIRRILRTKKYQELWKPYTGDICTVLDLVDTIASLLPAHIAAHNLLCGTKDIVCLVCNTRVTRRVAYKFFETML